MNRTFGQLFVLLLFSSGLSANPLAVFSDYSKGVDLAAQGQCDQAVSIFRAVLKENPKLVYSNVLIGICSFNNGDYLGASAEIKRFISNEENALDGSDKYPLALVYYLKCQNKLRNSLEFQHYYQLLEKYPIPNEVGSVFTAQALVEAAGDTTYPEVLRRDSYLRAEKILEAGEARGVKARWFNNTFGCLFVVGHDFEKDLDGKISMAKKAKERFANEITINDRSQVRINLAVSNRLIAEDMKSKFWVELKKFKAAGKRLEGYPVLREILLTGLGYLGESEKSLEAAKSAPGNEGLIGKLKKAQDLIEKVRNEYMSDSNIQKVLNTTN